MFNIQSLVNLFIVSYKGGGGDGQQYKVLSEMWCLKDSRCITQRYRLTLKTTHKTETLGIEFKETNTV